MKSSTALKKARKFIEEGLDHYVCHAIERAERGVLSTEAWVPITAVGRNLSEMFSPARPYSTVCGWLAGKHPHVAQQLSEMRGIEHDAAMRAYRIRWIDWMIKAYEKVGD